MATAPLGIAWRIHPRHRRALLLQVYDRLASIAAAPAPTCGAGACSPVARGRAREVGMTVSLMRPATPGPPKDRKQNKAQTSRYSQHELHHVLSPVRSKVPAHILSGTVRLRSQ